MSFFEAITCLAYAVFADAPVDVAVVEAGMGGRWDATNVADGQVAVVMPIGLDHVEYLGHDIATIAGEKAGIIKPGAFVVLAQQPLDAATVLLAQTAAVGGALAREGLEFGVVSRLPAIGGQVLTLQGLAGQYEDLFLPLFGAHQASNASAALAAVEAFLGGGEHELSVDLLRAGFAGVTSPARLEVVRRSPTVLIDAAHNPHGASALAAALDDAFEFTHLVGVLAVFGDKDARGLLETLEPVLNQVVITQSSSPRAMTAQDLGELATEIFGADRVTVVQRLATAIETGIQLADEAGAGLGGSGVLITGSVVTAAEARALLGRVEA
jgi:dihydrofolate synthase/folylpolyglutamate synthase